MTSTMRPRWPDYLFSFGIGALMGGVIGPRTLLSDILIAGGGVLAIMGLERGGRLW